MERHGDHRFHLIQLYHDHTVIVCHIPRIQLFVFLAASMDFIEILNLVVCSPDRRQAGGFCRHNIDADTEIRAQVGNSRAYKFHYFIFYITVCKDRADDRKRNVLRSYALCRSSCHIYAYNARHIDVIGLIQQLFYQLRTALAHCHCSKRAVTGV